MMRWFFDIWTNKKPTGRSGYDTDRDRKYAERFPAHILHAAFFLREAQTSCHSVQLEISRAVALVAVDAADIDYGQIIHD